MTREVTAADLTDEEILEAFLDTEPDDPLAIQCVRAASTDSTRRYRHESTDAFWERKRKRADARQLVAAAINARAKGGG